MRPYKSAVAKRKYDDARKAMDDRVLELIEQTRNGEIGSGKSVLASLLSDVSPHTKEKVSLRNIPSQMITLAVAGHETTAATLGKHTRKRARASTPSLTLSLILSLVLTFPHSHCQASR